MLKELTGLANPLKWKLVGVLVAALILTNTINWFTTSRIYYNKGVNVSKVAIADYQRQIAELQVKVNKATGVMTTKVITQYKDRVKYVDRVVTKNGETIVKYVPVPRDPQGNEIMVPAGWVYAHNQAALGKAIDPAKARDATPTAVSYNVALQIIAENYGAYQRLVAKDEAWQTWYKGLQQVYENYKNTEIKTNAK